MASQIRSFISYVRSQRTFEILMSPISISFSFFSRIRIYKIRIAASFSALMNNNPVVLAIKKPSMQIDIFKSLVDFRNSEFLIKGQSITAILNSLVQNFSDIQIYKITSNFILNTLSSFGQIIPIRKIEMTASSVIAYFYRLSKHDVEILGDLDSQTLGSLDYSES